MNTRFKNRAFKRFINITQLMAFSNNMEYDDGSPEPLAGAFYASTAYDSPRLNYFREPEPRNLAELLLPEDQQMKTTFCATPTYPASSIPRSLKPTRIQIHQLTVC